MDLVVFGIQGSGKGTQAKKLAEEFGYALFETGAALRKMASEDTELGRSVKRTIDAGHHVSSDTVMDVLRAALASCPKGTPMIFDGIPRNLEQMTLFDAVLEEHQRTFRCLVLTVDEERALQRILKRAETENRADDASEEAIRRRMALFHEKTEPVISAYRARGWVADVDGEGTVEEVYARVKAAMRSLGAWTMQEPGTGAAP